MTYLLGFRAGPPIPGFPAVWRMGWSKTTGWVVPPVIRYRPVAIRGTALPVASSSTGLPSAIAAAYLPPPKEVRLLPTRCNKMPKSLQLDCPGAKVMVRTPGTSAAVVMARGAASPIATCKGRGWIPALYAQSTIALDWTGSFQTKNSTSISFACLLSASPSAGGVLAKARRVKQCQFRMGRILRWQEHLVLTTAGLSPYKVPRMCNSF
jgi:hypothetical protein